MVIESPCADEAKKLAGVASLRMTSSSSALGAETDMSSDARTAARERALVASGSRADVGLAVDSWGKQWQWQFQAPL